MGFLKYIVLFLATALVSISHAKEASVLVYNETENFPMVSQNVTEVRPFASITKLMTAMVSLDYSPDVTRKIKASTSKLPYGEYSRLDIFTAMLVRSDNGAAETIANDYPGGRKAFIKAMNDKAKSLGMTQTNFSDESGLNRHNTATANDIRLMLVAASKYDLIRKTSIQKEVIFETQNKRKPRKIVIDNTNKPVLFEFDNIAVTKTGFTNPAGWCVALSVDQKGKTYSIIILGAKNKILRLDAVKEIMTRYILRPHYEEQPTFLFPL
jgi:D-alanyl-D-alanine endopeptidase (penicillin-binding protein 7)